MSYFKLIIIACLCNFYALLHSQDFTIGARYSYGEGTYKQINNYEKTAFTKIHQIGLTFAYSPYYSKLSIESGLDIEKKDLADYLSVPIGFRISVGKKIRPFFEGGAYYSFLIKDKSELYEMKNDFGTRIGGGIQFVLGRQWRLEFGAFKKFGFAGSLVEKRPIPGMYTYEKSRISPLNIEISLKYRY
jgi:hypothetical protein